LDIHPRDNAVVARDGIMAETVQDCFDARPSRGQRILPCASTALFVPQPPQPDFRRKAPRARQNSGSIMGGTQCGFESRSAFPTWGIALLIGVLNTVCVVAATTLNRDRLGAETSSGVRAPVSFRSASAPMADDISGRCPDEIDARDGPGGRPDGQHGKVPPYRDTDRTLATKTGKWYSP